MPLLDHFHPPVADKAPWTSIGTFWITAMVRSLNRSLPIDLEGTYLEALADNGFAPPT